MRHGITNGLNLGTEPAIELPYKRIIDLFLQATSPLLSLLVICLDTIMPTPSYVPKVILPNYCCLDVNHLCKRCLIHKSHSVLGLPQH